MTAAPDLSPDLPRQARRLRFEDAGLEARFREERQVQGLTRARVILIGGMFVVGGLGLADAMFSSHLAPGYVAHSLRLRFLGAVPVWAVLLLSTRLPGHVRRADWVYALGTVGVCWLVALIKWHWGLDYPRGPLAANVLLDILAILLISVATLPMHFRAVLATVVAALGGVLGFFAVTLLPARLYDLQLIAVGFVGIGGLMTLLSRYREAGERLLFAQREQLRILNTELGRLNAEKAEFMMIASHDLRAPLASVRGLAELLRAGSMPDPAKQAQAHAAIHELAGRMLGLVNNYLGAHAAESGLLLPVALAPLDLQAVADEAAARHAPMATKKQQRIAVAAGPAAWVQADAALLAQVTDNFLTNAVKFSAPGAGIRIAIALAEDRSVARFEVTDEGPGMTAEERSTLFQKFSRTSAQPTAGETSHGLGLAVAKRLAETMGGKVGCDSEPGAGATFWVELPVKR